MESIDHSYKQLQLLPFMPEIIFLRLVPLLPLRVISYMIHTE
jgi:hypothetical protein